MGESSEPTCIPIPVSPRPSALGEIQATPMPSTLREAFRPVPTVHPSASTRSPSSLASPPTVTVPGACTTIDGEYGSLRGGDSRIVSFLYSVELDRDVRLEEYTTNVVPALEVALNDYLIPVLFADACNSTNEVLSRRRLVGMATRSRRLGTLTGIRAFPGDAVYENVDCTGIFCFTMFGQVTVFFDTNSTNKEHKDTVIQAALSAAMDAGRFDNDPPITHVRYIADDPDMITNDRSTNAGGPASINETNASNSGPPVWVWVGLSLGLLGASLVLCWFFGRSDALRSWWRGRRNPHRAGTVAYVLHPSPEPSVILAPLQQERGSSDTLEKEELKLRASGLILPQSSSDSDSQNTPEPSEPLDSEIDTTHGSYNGSLVSSVDGTRLYHQLPQPTPNDDQQVSDLPDDNSPAAIAWRDPDDPTFSRPSTAYAPIRSNFDTATSSSAGWIASSSGNSSRTDESRILRIAGANHSSRSTRSTLQRITEAEEGDGIFPPNLNERASQQVRQHISSSDETSSDEELRIYNNDNDDAV